MEGMECHVLSSPEDVKHDDLYIMRYDFDLTRCKIGRSKDPQARKRSLEQSQDFCLEIAAVFPGKGYLEQTVHRKLYSSRSNRGSGKEWFQVALQEAVYVIADAIESDRISSHMRN